MKYSLIIPHFNDPVRLERLLGSVPVERKDLEVIVVDDCSSDRPALVELQARWPMVDWLSTLQNAGAGAARNVGLSKAQGKFLIFADSDDLFTSNAFTEFDQHIKYDDELVYFFVEAMQEIDWSKSIRADYLNKLCESYLTESNAATLENLKVGHVVSWAKVYSHKSIKDLNIKFDETRVSNDVVFNVISAIHMKNVRVVPTVVYQVLRRDGSLTSNSSVEAFLERVNVGARVANVLQVLGVKTQVSAAGYMLRSISYGPYAAYKTWRICIFSNMKVNFIKMFRISSWISFLQRQHVIRSEKSINMEE